ncbi:phosphoadenosine phosphosulfate reductase domain-containing protein [Paenibacillus abyssi]|nr:phosphoadenosine phosphosulfate reductase family protein [Paenibacillus abyssi]
MDIQFEFSPANHRIAIDPNLRKPNNVSRRIWAYLKDTGWSFLGVVREQSAVFSNGKDFLTLHHFLNETPVEALMGYATDIEWHEAIDADQPAAGFLSFMEGSGYHVKLPHQAWIDDWSNAILSSVLSSVERNWHTFSPKHKLQCWITDGKDYFNVEFFFDYPLPPYGVGEPLDWPPLQEQSEVTKLDLFELMGVNLPKPDRSISKPAAEGEAFEIADGVNPDLLAETYAVIEHCMVMYSHVLIAYSGGKDSHSCLQLVLRYKLEHPECTTKITVISADTLIENVLLVNHIYKVKERVESLGLGIDFRIVTPELDETFHVCVFGKGYAPPSSMNRWCVDRLKKRPADEVLEEYAGYYANQTGDHIVLLLGTRSAESSNRARSMTKFFGDEFFGEHQITGRTCAPIKRWTARDVITYLVRTEAPWEDYGNYNLINLYGSAAGGWEECPIGAAMTDINEGVSSCTSSSGARMGCTFCSVVKEDTSLINMAKDFPDELGPFVAMRKVFKAAQDIRYGSLTGYKRVRGTKAGEEGQMLGQLTSGLGDLTLDIRVLLLEKMFDLGLTIPQNEVFKIYSIVREREFPEGIALTRRFKDALFAFLPVHPGHFETSYSPIWDPWGSGVDAFTEEDVKAIERIKAQEAAARAAVAEPEIMTTILPEVI